MEKMKGLIQQMEERGKVHILKPFTEEDIIDIQKKLKQALEKDFKDRENRFKEIEENRLHLLKKSKEFGEEIPVELMYHALSFHRTFVGTEFFEKYKKWLE